MLVISVIFPVSPFKTGISNVHLSQSTALLKKVVFPLADSCHVMGYRFLEHEPHFTQRGDTYRVGIVLFYRRGHQHLSIRP